MTQNYMSICAYEAIMTTGSFLRFLLPVLIGVALGAALGYFGQCTSGTCPLTSTWWRGALYGGTMGLLIAISSRTS